MKNIKIFGSGCSNCKATMAKVKKVAETMSVEAEITKVEDILEIVKYGVVSTPAVAIDGKIVHSGGIPAEEDIKSWFEGKDC